MKTIDEIRRPIATQIAEYERFTARQMHSESALVDGILSYILENGGKGVRPLMVMLCAALQKPDNEHVIGMRTYLGALLVEMMHTASLVHDDVIDESDMRRGKPSVRARWGSRSAVITGDFILAKSITVGLDSAQYDIVDYVVRAMSELCEGELIQDEQSRKLEMTREIYLEIIRKKTAVLFGVSAGVGALSVGAARSEVARMRELGETVGIAFQIKDDILDYTGDRSGIGKPALGDLREQKITLPLLAVLERSSASRRAELLRLLAEVDSTPQNIDILHDTVIAEGGITEAERVMDEYIARAEALLECFPASPFRNSLALLVGYAAGRKK